MCKLYMHMRTYAYMYICMFIFKFVHLSLWSVNVEEKALSVHAWMCKWDMLYKVLCVHTLSRKVLYSKITCPWMYHMLCPCRVRWTQRWLMFISDSVSCLFLILKMLKLLKKNTFESIIRKTLMMACVILKWCLFVWGKV